MQSDECTGALGNLNIYVALVGKRHVTSNILFLIDQMPTVINLAHSRIMFTTK